MRNILGAILFTAAIVSLAYCSTAQKNVECDIETKAAVAMSNGIATALSCSNKAQIQSDLMGALGPENLCSTSLSSKPRGPLGNVICPLAVTAGLSLLDSKIPASWGCTGTVTSSLSATLQTACEAAVGI